MAELSTRSSSETLMLPAVNDPDPSTMVLPTTGESRAIDWRTISPSEIQGDSISIVELRYFRETFEELLKLIPGRYVLIVGREVVSDFPDLHLAAKYAAEAFPGQAVLIKKVAAIEPIHSIGGVID